MSVMYYNFNENRSYTLEEMQEIHQDMLKKGFCTEPNFSSWLEVQQEVNYLAENYDVDSAPATSTQEPYFDR